jgi:hypothetical protein
MPEQTAPILRESASGRWIPGRSPDRTALPPGGNRQSPHVLHVAENLQRLMAITLVPCHTAMARDMWER